MMWLIKIILGGANDREIMITIYIKCFAKLYNVQKDAA